MDKEGREKAVQQFFDTKNYYQLYQAKMPKHIKPGDRIVIHWELEQWGPKQDSGYVYQTPDCEFPLEGDLFFHCVVGYEKEGNEDEFGHLYELVLNPNVSKITLKDNG